MAEIESELHDSDDEYNLINEVDIMCLKILKAAIPFEAEMDKAIRTSIRAHENREVRIKRWRTRLANLHFQNVLEMFCSCLGAVLAGADGSIPSAAAKCKDRLALHERWRALTMRDNT